MQHASDSVGQFMLGLALAFNDLKGSQHILEWLTPLVRDRSHHSAEERGQVSGIHTQTARLTAGIIHEILELIADRRKVLQTPEFQRVLTSTDAGTQRDWKAVVDVALDRRSNDAGTLRVKLKTYRNKIGFHYTECARLGDALIVAFGERNPQLVDGDPAFSDGSSMEETRFYYADAAAKAAFVHQTGQDVDTAWREIREISRIVNEAIKPLLVAFLRIRIRDAGRQPD